jgi:hypothetical protein
VATELLWAGLGSGLRRLVINQNRARQSRLDHASSQSLRHLQDIFRLSWRKDVEIALVRREPNSRLSITRGGGIHPPTNRGTWGSRNVFIYGIKTKIKPVSGRRCPRHVCCTAPTQTHTELSPYFSAIAVIRLVSGSGCALSSATSAKKRSNPAASGIAATLGISKSFLYSLVAAHPGEAPKSKEDLELWSAFVNRYRIEPTGGDRNRW